MAIASKHVLIVPLAERTLRAFDTNTGAVKWNSPIHAGIIHGFDDSSITVSGNDGIVVLDASTGTVLLQDKEDKTPAVQQGDAIYGIEDQRTLICIKKRQVVWADKDLGFLPKTAYPTLYKGFLIYTGEMKWGPIGFVRVYEASSGKLLWDQEAEDVRDATERALLTAQWAGDRVVVHAEGKVTSRELATGREVWSTASDEAPVVSAEYVLVSEKSGIRVLEASSGKKLASCNSSVGIGSRVSTIVDGVIYTSSARGENTLGGMVHHWTLYAVDVKSGSILWQSKEDKRTDYSRPMVVDGMVVIASDKKVYAMKR